MTMLRSLMVGLALAAFACISGALAVSYPYSFLSGASTNSTLVFSGNATLNGISAVNTTATTYYLKVYDTATAPTCGSGTPKIRLPLPPQSTGGGSPTPLPPVTMVFGVGFCLTSGIADNDSGNAATGVALNFAISQL